MYMKRKQIGVSCCVVDDAKPLTEDITIHYPVLKKVNTAPTLYHSILIITLARLSIVIAKLGVFILGQLSSN